MMQESLTEGGWDAGVRQTNTAYPALSASPRRRLLVAITTIGTVVGTLPALVILDVFALVSVFAAIGVVGSAIYLQRFRTTRTVPPSAAEFVLAGVGTLLTPLFNSLLWIGAYFAVEGIADVLGLDERRIALIATIPLAVGFGVFYTLMAAENLASQLYPDVAGARSAHYAGAARKSTLVVGSAVTAAVVVITLLVFDSTDTKAAVLLGYGLFLSALGFGPSSEVPDSGETDQISALGDLLANHWLEVTPVPRSDDVALDPYLADIDLMAASGDTDYAVALVRGDEDPKGVRWTEAANLKLGAFAVGKVREDESGSERSVLPLLVVTASREDERLVAYCQAEQIDLVQVGHDGVRIHQWRDRDAWIEGVDWQSLQPAKGKKERSS
jgi:hypothetical protein